MSKNSVKTKDSKPEQPLLDTEVASRSKDPFVRPFMGVIGVNDPLLMERGGQGSSAHELYRDLLRDGKLFSGLQKRKLAVIGRQWSVDPVAQDASARKDAQLVTEILKGFAFDRLCSSLLDAMLIGWQPVEIVWTLRNGLVVPARSAKRLHRRFVYVQDDGDDEARLHLLTQKQMQRGERVPERKFVVHRVNEEDDNPYGTGLGLQLYWPVFFKRKGVLAWNMLCERFGSPVPWGKYPRDATPHEKATLFEGLRAMQTDGLIMTPTGADIALIETRLSSGAQSTHQGLCEFMDDWIMEVLLGQPPRGKGGGALAAAANEREDVRLELSQADSDLLCETLNETLIAWICYFNGLQPCRVSRAIDKPMDAKLEAETDALICSMGFEPTQEYVQEKYGQGWQKRTAPSAPQSVPQSAAHGMALAGFAESSVDEEAGDQVALDAGIAGLPDGTLNGHMQRMMQPLMEQLVNSDNPQAVLAWLAEQFPKLDEQGLHEHLAHLLFVADMWGRVYAENT